MIEITQYGFKWEALEVVRACSDAKYGVTMIIRTDKQEVEIRATPGGQLRVSNVSTRSAAND